MSIIDKIFEKIKKIKKKTDIDTNTISVSTVTIQDSNFAGYSVNTPSKAYWFSGHATWTNLSNWSTVSVAGNYSETPTQEHNYFLYDSEQEKYLCYTSNVKAGDMYYSWYDGNEPINNRIKLSESWVDTLLVLRGDEVERQTKVAADNGLADICRFISFGNNNWKHLWAVPYDKDISGGCTTHFEDSIKIEYSGP
jgi:hypothetical protein